MKVIVFDLDDTLYKEIDFLISAYHEIGEYLMAEHGLDHNVADEMLEIYQLGKNAFKEINNRYILKVPITKYLQIYRNHFPNITLDIDTLKTLAVLWHKGFILGLITDGRTVTQRNKIKSLRLDKYIAKDDIIISEEFGNEKPAEENYRFFMDKYPNSEYWYVGDNNIKDFVTPNNIGWHTICLLDDGRNIHKDKTIPDSKYLAKYKVNSLPKILDFVL